MLPQHNPQCFANHLGPYAIMPEWFAQAVEAIKAGTWKPQASAGSGESGAPYAVRADGVAIMSIVGPIMRGRSKFGGTSSLDLRHALRMARQDPKVHGIMLVVDSPGGAAMGSEELAREVEALTKVKPVHAHVEGEAGSAAYYAIALASRITASPSSMVGSIGTFAVLVDASKQAEMQGLKIHVVSSGPHKGEGVPGVPVTDATLASTQALVDALSEQFFAAVKDGRGMDAKALKAVTDGRMFMAAEGKKLGLVDAVQTSDEAMLSLIAKATARAKRNTARASVEIGLAGL